jgi:5-methyltetrahydrofolate--homocysteine methyltransferase
LIKPAEISAIHQAYAEAGADIVETNTFGGNRVKLSSFGLESKTVELNHLAVKIAMGSGALVAGSIGPTGKLLEPYGDLTFEEAEEAFKEQIISLVEAGAHLLVLETFSDMNELRAALNPALSTGIPVVATMAFDTGGRTMMGVSPADLVDNVSNTSISAIGANCGGGAKQMDGVAREFLSLTHLPIILQPNAGLPQLVNGVTVYKEQPEVLSRFFESYVDKCTDLRILLREYSGTYKEYR